MAVIAIFTYEVKPGRMDDFMAKLKEAAAPRFESQVMPKSFRLFRNTVPGPDTGPVIMMIEYDDMAAYEQGLRSRIPIRSGRSCSRRLRIHRRPYIRYNYSLRFQIEGVPSQAPIEEIFCRSGMFAAKGLRWLQRVA
jgi:hypothetical protein